MQGHKSDSQWGNWDLPHGMAKKENKLMVTKEEKRRGMN